MTLKDLHLILYCHCRESSLLVSESLDRPLTVSERLAMRLHHLVCTRCVRAARQLRQLHRILASMPLAARRAISPPATRLAPSVRKRIVEEMRQA